MTLANVVQEFGTNLEGSEARKNGSHGLRQGRRVVRKLGQYHIEKASSMPNLSLISTQNDVMDPVIEQDEFVRTTPQKQDTPPTIPSPPISSQPPPLMPLSAAAHKKWTSKPTKESTNAVSPTEESRYTPIKSGGTTSGRYPSVMDIFPGVSSTTDTTSSQTGFTYTQSVTSMPNLNATSTSDRSRYQRQELRTRPSMNGMEQQQLAQLQRRQSTERQRQVDPRRPPIPARSPSRKRAQQLSQTQAIEAMPSLEANGSTSTLTSYPSSAVTSPSTTPASTPPLAARQKSALYIKALPPLPTAVQQQIPPADRQTSQDTETNQHASVRIVERRPSHRAHRSDVTDQLGTSLSIKYATTKGRIHGPIDYEEKPLPMMPGTATLTQGPMRTSSLRNSRASSVLSRPHSMEIDESKLAAEVAAIKERSEDPAEKRRRVVSELVNTEAAFVSDMDVLHEVYYLGVKSSPLFEPTDCRALFINLEDIRTFSRELLEKLAQASRMGLSSNGKDYIYTGSKDDGGLGDGGNIGIVFLDMVRIFSKL
jgi:hypothetical protein